MSTLMSTDMNVTRPTSRVSKPPGGKTTYTIGKQLYFLIYSDKCRFTLFTNGAMFNKGDYVEPTKETKVVEPIPTEGTYSMHIRPTFCKHQ